MKLRRLIMFVTALTIFATMLIGCGGGGDTTTTTTAGSGTETEDTRPKLDFGGYEMTFAGGTYLPPDVPNTAIDEEWANLTAELEERINVKFSNLAEVEIDITTMTKAVMAGEKVADVIRARQNVYFPLSFQNGVYPVDGDYLKGLGLDCFDETRWVQRQGVLSTEFLGQYWGLQVASKYIMLPAGKIVFFNKELVAAAGYSDLYQLVRDHKWTWEVYMDISYKVVKDVNGDGIYDVWATGATAWGDEILSNNAEFMILQDGKYVHGFSTPNAIAGLEFLIERNYTSGTQAPSKSDGRQGFLDGTVAFNWESPQYSEPNGSASQILFDLGIVPMPMGPNATEYIAVNRDVDVMVFQTANKDLEKVIPILNEYALIVNDTESWKERFLDGRFRSEDDEDMFFNYIVPNYIRQIAKIDDNIWLYCNAIIETSASLGESPAAAIEQYGETLQSYIDDFFGQ